MNQTGKNPARGWGETSAKGHGRRSVMAITLALLAILLAIPGLSPVVQSADKPVVIGLDAEFGHLSSTSAEAIRRGIMIAIEEINQAGGVLGGRPLELQTKDNRSVPARGVKNVTDFAQEPEVVAVFTGKFSPVVQEVVPVAQRLGIPILDPWAAADDIVDNGFSPNFIFRLSLRDQWAMEAMLNHAEKQGLKKVGLMLPNTGWGRSSLRAAEKFLQGKPSPTLTTVQWYNWGDNSLARQYQSVLDAGSQVLILVANETEGSLLIKEVAALPPDSRRPILSHWGVSGGQLADMAGQALGQVDFLVVQTYSFIGANRPQAAQVLSAAKRLFNIPDARKLDSPVGTAHAYDLTYILAKAIDLAGSTDRSKIRDALEKVRNYNGLIKAYPAPFTPARHEALSLEDVFLARYESDGALVKAVAR